jgi:hypothetical protein
MRRCALLAVAVVIAGGGPALAAGIDLSKPYGDKYGCINRNGQEVAADQMLLLTDTDLVTAASACTFTDKQAQADGSLTMKAECEAEGEEGKSPVTFTVRRSAKNAKKLVITDEDGTVYGEVSRCR